MSAPIRDAPAPFSGEADLDNHCPPDFILRSSDGVDFHVHKEMLKLVSGFFEGMFRLPAGNRDLGDLSRNGITVLQMAEQDSVLYRLLRFAYPARSPGQYTLVTEADLDGIAAVHQAAHKYHFFHVELLINEMLANPALINAYPHRLFGIARLLDLPELARAAALSTLRFPFDSGLPSFPEMALLRWSEGQKLAKLHRLCGLDAQKIAQDQCIHSHVDVEPIWFDFRAEHDGPCGPCVFTANRSYSIISPAPWFVSHMGRIASHLLRVPSHHQVEVEAQNISMSDRAVLNACFVCRTVGDRDLAPFARELEKRINESNERLALEIL
ncbi:hypothetical protein C8R44DRAFT_687366 [Mycena epipterygia]|nr:hypothetical protein C8R44DRAFT_687366 [Mycena epipterygia]